MHQLNSIGNQYRSPYKFVHNHNLESIQYSNSKKYTSTPTLLETTINDNNNYVNLHDVTSLRLYNKLILVTQKQVLELYITAIEHKTLYGLRIPRTAFPNALQPQLPMQLKQRPTQQQTKTKGPCYQDRNRDLAIVLTSDKSYRSSPRFRHRVVLVDTGYSCS